VGFNIVLSNFFTKTKIYTMRKITLLLFISIAIFKNMVGQNVGIGINTPQTKLHVNGTTRIGVDTLTDAQLELRGNNAVELGAGKVKELNAGKIGYQIFSNGLDIVGAGTTNANRAITFWNEGGAEFKGGATFNGNTTITQNLTVAAEIQGNSLKEYSANNEAVKNKIQVFSPTTSTLDQGFVVNGAGAASGTSSAWQSFTAGSTGTLAYVSLYISNNVSTTTYRDLKIFKGEGVNMDSLLITVNFIYYSLGVGYINSPDLNIPVISGQKYTIWLDNQQGWSVQSGNPYPNGTSWFSSNTDYIFRTYLISGAAQNVFSVSNQGDIVVAGKTSTNDLQITNGAGVNKILSSDAVGNASWQNPTAINTNWTVSGNRIYNNNTGNVGIGLSNPTQKLHVNNGNIQVGRTNFWFTPADNRFLQFGDSNFVRLGESGALDRMELYAKEFVFKPSDAIYNGNVGIGTTLSPAAKLDIESPTNTALIIRGQNSQIRIIENDNANKQWKFEVNNSNFSVTEDAVAIPFVIKAGSDANVLVTTNDTVQIKKLQVGSNGTAIAKMQNGQTTLGTGTTGVNNFTIAFPTAFTGIPKVTATLETTNVNDVFTMSVKQISTTSFVVQVYRIDVISGAWGQSLKVNWSAWE
jgi:hypothetical protein